MQDPKIGTLVDLTSKKHLTGAVRELCADLAKARVQGGRDEGAEGGVDVPMIDKKWLKSEARHLV